MLSRTMVVLVLGIILASPSFAAGSPRPTCANEKDIRAEFLARGRWAIVTRGQWQFLRGVYAMNPSTPPGLPPGTGAVLATLRGSDDGVVFFVDGARVCNPMAAPKALIKMLQLVGAGNQDPTGDEM